MYAAPSAVKAALEDLLRTRKLQADEPPLRGEDRRGRALATGIAPLDDLLHGGFPRGQVSEIHGAASSGRTGLVVALVARLTRAGSLVAWVDPADRLDPASASAAGVALPRLFWIRGDGRARDARALLSAISAVGTLLGSGLFEAVVLDLAGVPASVRQRLPGTTWIRLQRMVEDQPTALVLLADGHVAHSPGGATLALSAAGPRWSGIAPARLFTGIGAEVREARRGIRAASLELQACL
jgi:RecA/RadA recombinase